ncbi:hypothetical protein LB456_06610 [Psychroflexus sp. CAK57W]|uniref:hypothetical protein n=1 Tax=Psychroflexus curvus TaxID=2873595 RepID=UPI001CCB5665|nr:hypothetical protein [Psychroflexus curvus]MBZ9627122.1 hypothetical protein [Psychroflexus curvus]MBZ9787128.1 hypothetical protein [Psychroflexus curvus]
MKIKRSNFVFCILAIIALLLGVVSSFIFPEKYFYDAYKIVLDLYDEKGLMGSYPFAMLFYDITFLNELSFPVIAIIQIPILFYLLFKIKIPNIFGYPVLRNIPIYLSLLALAVYLSQPSKEFLNFIFFFFIVSLLQKKISLEKKILYSCFSLIILGVFYRPYFALMPFLGLGLYFITLIKFKNKVVLNITTGLLIASFMSLSFGIVKGEFMSESTREMLNKNRIGRSDSETIIVSPVETNSIFGEIIGIFYGFFTVNFPVNGLKFFYKPQVLAFVFWQILLFSYTVYFYGKCLRNQKLNSHKIWVFHLFISYLIIQGVFEPDLGSAIKHKLGVFPLMWLVFYYDQGLIKRPKTITRYVFKSDK